MNLIPDRRTLLQILFWGMLWVLVPILASSGWEYSNRYLVRSLIVFSGIILVIWLNVEVLLPRLFFRKKLFLYVLAVILLLATVSFLQEWDAMPWSDYFNRPKSRGSSKPPGSSPWQILRYIGVVMPYFTALISCALVEIASYANRKAAEASEFRSEKLEAEMKFLKSQFNPHFLFNALNNIYTLSVIKSDQTPDNLLKLSGMLRYMLYDCKALTVPLKKEIEYIRHFIDLQLLKDSRGLNVKVELDESRPSLDIAPMLLIPFVENAFKHSRIEDLENGWIEIKLETGEQQIRFTVRNSLPKKDFTKDHQGGIGLENVKRQLELVYPKQHELWVGERDGVFEARLKIRLVAA